MMDAIAANDMPHEEQVFAFDIPLGQSPDEAARLIDDLCPDGFYPWQLVALTGIGVRVFCKRSKASKPGELAAARLKAAAATRKAKDVEDLKAEQALAEILAASPRLTVGLARVKLSRNGFRRGTDWVREAMPRARHGQRGGHQ